MELPLGTLGVGQRQNLLAMFRQHEESVVLGKRGAAHVRRTQKHVLAGGHLASLGSECQRDAWGSRSEASTPTCSKLPSGSGAMPAWVECWFFHSQLAVGPGMSHLTLLYLGFHIYLKVW